MADALTLAWRQYRLERKLFWRNPSAAFFNFLLPLLFLALFGAILQGKQHDLNVIVPGIAGIPVILISGVFYDAARAPGFIKGIAEALPLTHLINGLSGAMVKGTSISANI